MQSMYQATSAYSAQSSSIMASARVTVKADGGAPLLSAMSVETACEKQIGADRQASVCSASELWSTAYSGKAMARKRTEPTMAAVCALSKAAATSRQKQNIASSNTKYSTHTLATSPPKMPFAPSATTSEAVSANCRLYVASQEASSAASLTPIMRTCSRKRSCLSATSARTISTAFQLNATISMIPTKLPTCPMKRFSMCVAVGMGTTVRLGETGAGMGALGCATGGAEASM